MAAAMGHRLRPTGCAGDSVPTSVRSLISFLGWAVSRPRSLAASLAVRIISATANRTRSGTFVEHGVGGLCGVCEYGLEGVELLYVGCDV